MSTKWRAPSLRSGLLIFVALWLLAMPTFFTVFPGCLLWSRSRRIWIFAAWLIVALFAAVASQVQQVRQSDQATATNVFSERSFNILLRNFLEELLGRDGTKAAPGYRASVYLADDH